MRTGVALKTQPEIARIRRTAEVVSTVLRECRALILPGRTTAEIARRCAELLVAGRALPPADAVDGFPGPVCVSVNNIAAHGVPGPYRLESGDLVTVDVTGCIDGWFADAAWTFGCGTLDADAKRLVRTAWQASRAGALAAISGSRVGDVAYSAQLVAKRSGCQILAEFAGHGIGRKLHEDPIIRFVGRRRTGGMLVPGMVLTIEPVVSLGGPGTYHLSDSWSIATSDGMRTAQYEHTLALSAAGTENLTCPAFAENVDFPPYF